MSTFKAIKGWGSDYECQETEDLTLELEGAVALEAKNFSRAAQFLTLGKLKYSKNPSFYFLMGFLKESLKDFDNAILEYRDYLQRVPKHYPAYFRIGLCYQNSNRFEQALTNYNEAENNYSPFFTDVTEVAQKIHGSKNINTYYNISPEQIYNNRGVVKIKFGDIQGAIEDCSKAISCNPNYPNAYFIRGLQYYKLDQMDKAKRDIEQASRLGYPNAIQFLKQNF